jgi:hypothetical protein
MPSYRCYCLDPAGCVRAVSTIAAETDDGAEQAAAELLGSSLHHAVELWVDRRLVGTIDRDAFSWSSAATPARPPDHDLA